MLTSLTDCYTCANRSSHSCHKCAGLNPDIPTYYWSPDKETIKNLVFNFVLQREQQNLSTNWEDVATQLGYLNIDFELWTEAISTNGLNTEND